jgi:beta-glucanase (GH16 family)
VNRAALASASLTAVVAAGLPLTAPGPAQGAVRQTASLSVTPGIAQNGPRVASAHDASLLGEARFRPARRGRVVLVQRRLPGGRWQPVVRKRQDARGRVRFVRDAARGRTPYAYRAVALRTRTLPQAISNGRSSTWWTPKFHEAFRGTELDRSRWSYRHVGLLRGTRMHAESSRDAVHVRGGYLDLQVRDNPARPTPGVTKPAEKYYLNGHISTMDKFSFTYGYAAARIKFHRGQGQHGAFWMQPQSRTAEYGPVAQTGAEVDVAEYFGEGFHSGGLAHFVYDIPEPGKTRKHGMVQPRALSALRGPRDRFWSRYHVFSVHWTPTQYVFRIDGVETWRLKGVVTRRPEYLLLSLLSSDWELPRLQRETMPTSMKVDWVRVWQH